MNKQEIEQTIANVEQQLASLKAELLKQATNTDIWERKGMYILCDNGSISQEYSSLYTKGAKEQGRTYQTKDAAESVKPYDAFYGLLCGLACELNPSGKVGGYWNVTFLYGSLYWACHESRMQISTNSIFETSDAAQQAAKILNRDGIKPPQVGGAK